MLITNNNNNSELHKEVEHLRSCLQRAITDDRENNRKHEELTRSLSAAEATVHSLQLELEQERNRGAEVRGGVDDQVSRTVAMRDEMQRICSLCVTAMSEWDVTLEELVDGIDEGLPVRARFSTAKGTTLPTKASFKSLSSHISSPRILSSGRSVHGNMSFADADDWARVDDTPSVSAKTEELTHKSIVLIERVRSLISRIVRIRSSFQLQSQNVNNLFETKLNSTNDKVSILSHKISDASTLLQRLQIILQRDLKKSAFDVENLRKMREELSAEYRSRLENESDRCRTLQLALEKERQEKQDLQFRILELEKELTEAIHRHEVSQSDVRSMESLERMVATLTEKTANLTSAYELCNHELETYRAKLQESDGTILGIA